MRVNALMFALIGLLWGVSAASAEDYRDIARRFTITLPSGWTRIPDVDVKKFDSLVAERFKDRNFQYIAGFTKNVRSPLEVPYVLVQETNVRLKDSSYEELEKSLNAVDIGAAEKEVAARITEDLMEFKSDQWALDKSRGRMVMHVKVADARGQSIVGLCTAYFGNESIIQLNCYAEEKELSASRSEFDALAESFRFDRGAEYEPAQLPGIWSGPIRTGIIGAVCGLGVAIVLIAVQRFKRAA